MLPNVNLAVYLVFASALSLASAERILVARQCTDVCCTFVSTVFGPPAWYCDPGTSCSSGQIATCCTQTSSGWDCP